MICMHEIHNDMTEYYKWHVIMYEYVIHSSNK